MEQRNLSNHKFGYFPRPYDDETIVSIVARYHRHLKNSSIHNQTLIELFGSAASKVDSLNRLGILWERTRLHEFFSFEAFIQNHTTRLFFTAFLAKRSQHLVYFRGSKNYVNPLPNWSENSYCPDCIKDDLERYDEPYWHRVHQIPGVRICPIHGTLLRKLKMEKSQFVYLDEKNLYPEEIQTETILDDYNQYRDYSEDVFSLFKCNRSFDLKRIKKTYVARLQDLGIASGGGHIDLQHLCNELLDYYGSRFLGNMGCSIENVPTNWLYTAFVGSRLMTISTICHLLLIRFLFGSFENFLINLDHEQKPFGVGPWPCLNTLADHYRELVIEDCMLSHPSKGNPIGIFSCKCGFVYSRKGPDKLPEDKFKIRSIRKYGRVWEDGIQELSNLGFSNREIASELRIGYTTLYPSYKQLLRNGPDYLFDQEELSNCKAKITSLLESCSNRTQLYRRIYHEFQYVRKHDSDWLDRVIPKQKVRMKKLQWDMLDDALSKQLLEEAIKMYSLDQMPIRINAFSLYQHVCKRDIGDIKKRDLQTLNILEKIQESQEHYLRRKIRWAIRRLDIRGIPLDIDKVRCTAQIRVKAYLKYNLKETILELIEQHEEDLNIDEKGDDYLRNISDLLIDI